MKRVSLLVFVFSSLFCLITDSWAQNQAPMLDSTSTEPSLYERIAGQNAQELSSHMNFNFCTTEHTDFQNFEFTESKFKIRRMRWEIYGDIAPTLSFHFRQNLNGSFELSGMENINNSIEMAFVRWKPTEKVELMIGKQFLNVSGYECWVNGVDVREFSDFNDYFNPCRAGVTANFHFTPDQMLGLQLANSIPNTLDKYLPYNVPTSIEKSKAPLIAGAQWIGYFADKALMLQYSASFGNMAKNKNQLMLTGGNVWKKGPVTAYLDFMYSREGLDTKGLVSQLSDLTTAAEGNAQPWAPVSAQNVEYFTTIANIDYRVHKNWNVFVKGAFETAGVYESNGLKNNQEILFPKGLYKRTWNGQLCAEYIPMPERDNLRFYAHLLYKKYNYTSLGKQLGAANNDMQRITLGLVYTIPVF